MSLPRFFPSLALVSVCAVASAAEPGPVAPAASAPATTAAVSFPPCDRVPTEPEVQAAQGAFQAGLGSYRERDYRRAIEYWEDAFRRDCTAVRLLLNLSRAYENDQRYGDAVTALETYLQRTPEGTDHVEVERSIQQLRERDLDQRLAAEARAREAEQARLRAEAEANAESMPPPASSRPVPWAPIVVTGVGAAAALTGAGVYFLSAKPAVDDYEAQCPDRQCPDDATSAAANDARSTATLWGIVGWSGLAVTAGGAAWYFLEVSKPPRTTAAASTWTPVLAPGYAGVHWSGAL